MEVPEDVGVEVPKEINMAASAETFRKRSIVGGASVYENECCACGKECHLTRICFDEFSLCRVPM